jgi:hypothetical protein
MYVAAASHFPGVYVIVLQTLVSGSGALHLELNTANCGPSAAKYFMCWTLYL